MKTRKRFCLVLTLAAAVCSLFAPTLAMKSRSGVGLSPALMVSSGGFHDTISAGKCKKFGSGMSLGVDEVINFNGGFTSHNASVDFGLLDSNNVFIYINATKGTVNGNITIPEFDQYTPVIRNNSEHSVYVFGFVESYQPDKTDKKPSIFPFGGF